VLMLAATGGTELRATAVGDDEKEAMSALDDLFSKSLGEESKDRTSNGGSSGDSLEGTWSL